MQSLLITGDNLSLQEVTGDGLGSGQAGVQQCWLRQIDKLGGRRFAANKVNEFYPLTFSEEGKDNVVCDGVESVISYLDERYKRDLHGGFTLKEDHFVRNVTAQGVILPFDVPALTKKDADTPFDDRFVVYWDDGSLCQVNNAKSYPMRVVIEDRLDVVLSQPADWFLKVVYGLNVPPGEITGYSIGNSAGRENLMFWEVPYKHDSKTPEEITVTRP